MIISLKMPKSSKIYSKVLSLKKTWTSLFEFISIVMWQSLKNLPNCLPLPHGLGLLSLSVPSHRANSYPSSGIAVIVTTVFPLYVVVFSGDTDPPSLAVTVKVYWIRAVGSGTALSFEQEYTNCNKDNTSMKLLKAPFIRQTCMHQIYEYFYYATHNQ